jgi:hypothetical protein
VLVASAAVAEHLVVFSAACVPQVDMEGKRASWEGVVKVPFVDEVGCCSVCSSCSASYTADQGLSSFDL